MLHSEAMNCLKCKSCIFAVVNFSCFFLSSMPNVNKTEIHYCKQRIILQFLEITQKLSDDDNDELDSDPETDEQEDEWISDDDEELPKLPTARGLFQQAEPADDDESSMLAAPLDQTEDAPHEEPGLQKGYSI